MLAAAKYEFQRGETISLGLDVVSGDPETVDAIAAQLKPVSAGRGVLPNAPAAATFVITWRPAANGQPAGWTLTIPAIVSAGLSSGLYATDARLTVGDDVTITEPVQILIGEPVSTA